MHAAQFAGPEGGVGHLSEGHAGPLSDAASFFIGRCHSKLPEFQDKYKYLALYNKKYIMSYTNKSMMLYKRK